MKLYETINAENWTKHSFGHNETRKCMYGHLDRVPFRERTAAKERIKDAIAVLFPERGMYPRDALDLDVERTVLVTSFNDHHETTVADVIRVCKLADV